MPASRPTRFPTSAPASSWARAGRRRATIVEAADITRSKGPKAHRTVRGAEGDVVDRVGNARHLVQDQGRELFDLVGLRDVEPLHRQCRWKSIQCGKQDMIFAGGCEELDWTLSALFDAMGAMSSRLQSDAGDGLARL